MSTNECNEYNVKQVRGSTGPRPSSVTILWQNPIQKKICESSAGMHGTKSGTAKHVSTDRGTEACPR